MLWLYFNTQQSSLAYRALRIPVNNSQAPPTRGSSASEQQNFYVSLQQNPNDYQSQYQYVQKKRSRCLSKGLQHYSNAANMISMYTRIGMNRMKINFQDQSVEINLKNLSDCEISLLADFENVLLSENDIRGPGDFFSSVEGFNDGRVIFRIPSDIYTNVSTKNRIMYVTASDDEKKNNAISNIRNAKEPLNGGRLAKVVAGGIGCASSAAGAIAAGYIFVVSAVMLQTVTLPVLLMFGLPAVASLCIAAGFGLLLKSGLNKSSQSKNEENRDIEKLNNIKKSFDARQMSKETVVGKVNFKVKSSKNKNRDSEKDSGIFSNNFVDSHYIDVQNQSNSVEEKRKI